MKFLKNLIDSKFPVPRAKWLLLLTFLSGPKISADEINGVVYFPAKAYNFDQMWMDYDPNVTERDLGYAQQIHINALRVFGSYYSYARDPGLYKYHIDDLLTRASAKGMKVLFVLYENCGHVVDDPILRSLHDPLRAFGIQSPATAITTNPGMWQPYRDHVRWFMANFRNDPRLLGIEVINEPADNAREFAHTMVREAVAMKGTVPISVGTLDHQILEYVKDGVDVLQFHNNFPESLASSEQIIETRLAQARSVNLPIWMTEWQRTRPSGPHWGGAVAVPAAERYPNFASMAPQVKRYRNQLGAFFWSLMVKPAYLDGQRNAGTVNGLFWEDGSVWDIESARIIADDPNLNLPVKKRVPFETLRFENKGSGRWLQATTFADGSGQGLNAQAVPSSFTGDKTKWRIIRIDNEDHFRLESVSSGQWLEVSGVRDVTSGAPDPIQDNDTRAVRLAPRSKVGDSTRWRWVKSGDGDWYFRLQNKATGFFLQVTPLTDRDGNGFDGGVQIRAVPAGKLGTWTSFRSIDAN